MADTTMKEGGSLKARWGKLDGMRHAVLKRARKCAELTIPSLLPPEGATQNTTLKTPWQGLGARGVNNLASKLLLTLLPPNNPFFRMMVDDYTLEQLGQGDARAQVEKALNSYERAVQSEIETQAIRVQAFEVLKHLIVTGNALAFLPDTGGMRVYRLDQFCVQRDPMGNVLEILIKETVHPLALPEELQKQFAAKLKDPDETVDVYTHVLRTPNGWRVRQEIDEQLVPDSEGVYPLDASPWIPLRWSAVVGEDYGRGLVEEYLGDLLTLEALTKAVTEGSVAAARILFLVDPNGVTRARKLQDAPNGAFVEGRQEDVSPLQMNKYADFRVAQEIIQTIEQRLSYAFLLVQAVQRDAERVTAEEIRTMAKELEDALGGVYSVLSQEFQLPLVRRLIAQMERAKKLPPLPQQVVKPTIVTGLEALGRGNDLQRLGLFIQSLAPLGPDAIATWVNVPDYITRVGTAVGLDTNGLVRTEAEVQQMQQLALMQNMVGSTIPGATQEIVKGVVQAGASQAQAAE